MTTDAPLILTLTLNEEALLFFTALRKAHFPPERNFLEAHLTLFHHLPPNEEKIREDITNSCTQQPVLPLQVTEVVCTGRGVAYRISSPELLRLHHQLQQEWKPWLIPQDQHRLWPHITVQNKVMPQVARSLQQALSTDFAPFEIYGTGLSLWAYRGGPWEFIASYPFGVD